MRRVIIILSVLLFGSFAFGSVSGIDILKQRFEVSGSGVTLDGDRFDQLNGRP